jgi:hypothetical protein
MDPLNWSAAAAIVGKSRQAVCDLVKRGVLTDCVVRDPNGRAIGVKDAASFTEEYAAKVRPRAGGGGKEAGRVAARSRRSKPALVSAAERAPQQHRPADRPRTTNAEVPDYNESRAKTEYEKSLLLEIERRQKEGQLVERESVVNTWAQLINSAKTKLLGVRTACRQRIPHLTAEEAEIIDALIRDAMEGLAEDAGCPAQVQP